MQKTLVERVVHFLLDKLRINIFVMVSALLFIIWRARSVFGRSTFPFYGALRLMPIQKNMCVYINAKERIFAI